MDLLGWAIVALVIALIAGAMGYTGVARSAASITYLLVGIFLILAVVLFLLVLLDIGIVA